MAELQAVVVLSPVQHMFLADLTVRWLELDKNFVTETFQPVKLSNFLGAAIDSIFSPSGFHKKY